MSLTIERPPSHDNTAAGMLEPPPRIPETLPSRILGRTGVPVPILGFGLAPLGSENTSVEEATRIVHAAIDLGVTFLDVAPVYGQAESKLKEVLRTRRDEVFLVTKANSERPTREGVLQQIEESLERMGTGHLDAVHLHNLGSFDMEQVFAPEGALGGLIEARRRGLIRFIAASGHMRPARFAAAFETGEIDFCMIALNFVDQHTYDFEGLVLPAAARANVGVLAMKVLGGSVDWKYDARTPAHFAAHHERAIRYALGLPGVASAVIGFANEAEIRQAIAVVRDLQPLPEAERLELLAEGRRLAGTRGTYFGEVSG